MCIRDRGWMFFWILRPGHAGDGGEQQKIISMFQHGWGAYKRYAWGKDEFLPLSREGNSRFGLCATMVDAMDTMWLMGLRREFDECAEYVEANLQVDLDKEESLFETSIRILGGLLAAHSLANRPGLLVKATSLGENLLKAFREVEVPPPAVNLKTGVGRGLSCLSEPTTLQLEFRLLSRLVGKPALRRPVDKVMELVQKLDSLDGLLPLQPRWHGGRQSGRIGLGARGDSYYEYLLKQAIQSPEDPRYKSWYNQAVDGMEKHLLQTTAGGTMYMAELDWDGDSTERLVHKMDHLVCFVPGMLALGVQRGMDDKPAQRLRLAEALMQTCWRMYAQTKTGLAPEIVQFRPEEMAPNDMWIKPNDAFSRLRPETVESLFVLWRVTHNPKYRTWGRQIAAAIERHAKVEAGGYAVVKNVDAADVVLEDKMETFLLAETFKYLFLLFSPDEIVPLDKFVFNTEAHPFPLVVGS
eukprot:TRINITY_DN38591_c0_g1_i1.p1 TRINITY_DN38591_c0_g1~~TRINITY_DN38591_c0_g1_i1.p1  ORF type:complete len:469 (-),score=107.37 TRINITY_DN38591_c0_g1_i1:253-1659(-)